jgi:hypothetical protein
VTERQRIVDAAVRPGAPVAGVRGRMASTRSWSSNGFAVRGKVGRIVRRGQRGTGGDKLVAGGERNPEVCSDPPCRGAAGAPTLTPAELEGTPGLPHDPPSAARPGVMEVRLPNGAQVRIEEGVDGEVLLLVLSTLSGL